MKQRKVQITKTAQADIDYIISYISRSASVEIAERWFVRFKKFLHGFDLASERGTIRSELRSGIRIVGYRGQVTVAFEVTDDSVFILRVFWKGRNWEEEF